MLSMKIVVFILNLVNIMDTEKSLKCLGDYLK